MSGGLRWRSKAPSDEASDEASDEWKQFLKTELVCRLFNPKQFNRQKNGVRKSLAIFSSWVKGKVLGNLVASADKIHHMVTNPGGVTYNSVKAIPFIGDVTKERLIIDIDYVGDISDIREGVGTINLQDIFTEISNNQEFKAWGEAVSVDVMTPLRADAEAEVLRLRAKAKAEVQRLRAKADADAEALAEADAEANKVYTVDEALSWTSNDNFLKKWGEVLGGKGFTAWGMDAERGCTTLIKKNISAQLIDILEDANVQKGEEQAWDTQTTSLNSGFKDQLEELWVSNTPLSNL